MAEAIDGAGGGRLNYWVVDDSNTARAIIKALKARKAGRATFLPLDSIRSRAPIRGKQALIVDLMRFNPMYESIMYYVFSDTVLAKDFEEGKQLKAKYNRIVTLDGTVFDKSGAISGGKAKSSVAMGKKAEEMKKELDELKERKRSIIAELDSVTNEMYSERVKRSKIEAEIEKEKEMAEQLKVLDEMKKEKEKAKEKIKPLEETLSKKKAEIEEAERRLAKLKEERKNLEDIVKEVIAEVSSEKERLKGLESKTVELKRDLEKLKSEKEELLKNIEIIEKKERSLRDKKNILFATITSKEEELSQKYKEIEGITKELQKIEQDMQRLGGEKGEANKSAADIEKRIHSIEISLASLEEKLKNADDELKAIGEFEFVDKPISHLQRELTEAEREMAALRDIVNFAAEQAYEEYKAKVEDMEEKVEKLKAEKKAVLDLIKEIENRKREAFMEAFNTFKERFKEMFKYIHGFGEGELVLKNSENVGEAELDIKIKREGKEIYIESLAGGEKTLVSLFFLFALNMVRPMPFYLFDEVDQALDKYNSEHMIEFIQNISKKGSQFIIISHKDNVANKADVLIGVAKQNKASTIVELRRSEKVVASKTK